MAKKRSMIQRMPLAPIFAAMFGFAGAALVAATPQWLFESTVVSSGIAEVLSVAQPPLGIKARLLAIFFALAVTAVIGWVAGDVVERLLFGPRPPKPVVEDSEDDGDDALDLGHFAQSLPPVEMPRRPIFADRELGAPLMSDEALATGAMLAEPFPAFDPTPFEDKPVEDELFAEPMNDEAPLSVLEAPEPEPAAFVPEVAEDPVLQTPLAIEEFDLPAAPEESEILPGESNIDALIRRLEAGIARRGPPQPPHPGAPVAAAPVADPRDWMVRDSDAGSLDEDTTRALGTLRRMVG